MSSEAPNLTITLDTIGHGHPGKFVFPLWGKTKEITHLLSILSGNICLHFELVHLQVVHSLYHKQNALKADRIVQCAKYVSKCVTVS